MKDSLLPILGAGHCGSVIMICCKVKSLVTSACKIDFRVASETWYGGKSAGFIQRILAFMEMRKLESVRAPSKGP